MNARVHLLFAYVCVRGVHIIDEPLFAVRTPHRTASGQRKTIRLQPIALKFISTITASLIRRVWHGLMVVVIANGMGVAQTLESRANRRR